MIIKGNYYIVIYNTIIHDCKFVNDILCNKYILFLNYELFFFYGIHCEDVIMLYGFYFRFMVRMIRVVEG